MVTRKNDYVIGVISVDELFILVYGISCSAIPIGSSVSLIGREYRNPSERSVEIPGQTVADILVEHKRLVLCQYSNGVQL